MDVSSFANSTVRKVLAGAAIVLFVLPGVQVLGKDCVREPVFRFINFYLDAQKADARMSLWERVVYGVALARSPAHQPPASTGN
jgi:hypothetical protein